jgi:hypothetical protein
MPVELCAVGFGYVLPATAETAAPVGQAGRVVLPEEVAAAERVDVPVDPAAPLEDVEVAAEPHAAITAPHTTEIATVRWT